MSDRPQITERCEKPGKEQEWKLDIYIRRKVLAMESGA